MSAAREALRAWVVSRDKAPESPIDDHTRLFEERRITSLDLPELLLLLEELREEAIDVSSITPASFASIDAIAETYLS